MAKSVIDGSAMGGLLLKAHLGGLLDECVLTVKDGIGSIQALEMTNTVCIFVTAPLGDSIEDMELGLSRLGVLCKFFKDVSGEVSYSINEEGNWMTLKRGKAGQIKTVLLVPDEVPTKIKQKPGEPIKDKLLEKCKIDFKASQFIIFINFR